MSHANLGDFCQQPTLKASTEKSAQLVYNSTNQLHEPVQSILSALNLRAMGLRQSANFDAALRDADVMQRLSTFSALGYIRAAEVYSEQGKQSHVIDVCSKGLDVVDTKDPHYPTLLQMKMDAEQRQSIRIDFISKLPIDLVTTTLIRMFMDDGSLDAWTPCPYLYVSNLWRDRVIQCFGGLRFRVGSGEDESDTNLLQVNKFARYTKEIEIPWYSEAPSLADLVLDHDFCMLQKLELIGFVGYNIRRLVTSLHSISSTLTHLKIYMGSGTMLDISEVVLACPNLVSLWVFEPMHANLSSLPKKTWPKLKRLSIREAEEDVTPKMVAVISQRFPSLNQLDLHPCRDLESARIITKRYRHMNTVKLTVDGWDTEVDCSHEGNECEGITDFSIVEQYDGEETRQRMSPMLKQHHTTIDSMTWGIEPVNGDKALYNIQYPRLKKLSLNKSGWWIPRKAPVLQELKITSTTISASPSVLDTIPPNLKKLEIDLARGPDIDDKMPIVHYLHQFSQHAHLKELAIFFYRLNDTGCVMDAIPSLGRLQRLMIKFPTEIHPIEMEGFFDTLANGCRRLSCLEMQCGHTPTTPVMDALSRLEHLQYFAISVKNGEGTTFVDPSFLEAIKKLSQLKSVRIKRTMVANMDGIRRLKEQRPDLNIIVDDRFTSF